MAKQVLEQFQEHPDAWKRVDGILEKSSMPESKVSFFLNCFIVRVKLCKMKKKGPRRTFFLQP